MTGLDYIKEKHNDNNYFYDKEDREWFASLLDDYATNYYKRARANVFYALLGNVKYGIARWIKMRNAYNLYKRLKRKEKSLLRAVLYGTMDKESDFFKVNYKGVIKEIKRIKCEFNFT